MTNTTHAFTVVGEQKIHCEGCEQQVGRALRRLEGVRDVTASHKTQQVVVSFLPTQVHPEQVRAKLEQLGYEIQEEASA